MFSLHICIVFFFPSWKDKLSASPTHVHYVFAQKCFHVSKGFKGEDIKNRYTSRSKLKLEEAHIYI